jgi:competence protein ComEC
MPHTSVVLILACLAWIAGIAVSTTITVPLHYLQWIGGVGCGVLLVWWRRPPMVCGLLLLACVGGLWRGGNGTTTATPPFGQQTFTAQIVREPEIRVDRQRIVVQPEKEIGLVQINTLLQPRFQFGDVLQVRCDLKQPEPFDGFAYDKYLERHGIVATCSYAQITHIGVQESWRREIFTTKHYLGSGLQRAIAPPEHTIILGALFGQKKAIPDEIAEAFRQTGTSHVLVISGLHIGLITIILAKTLEWCALARSPRFAVTAAVLILYVFLTGAQPSAIRASSIGIAILVAMLLGRPRSLLRLLVYIATVMLTFNPLLFWYDVGFQLSFAATGSIVLLHERIGERLSFLPNSVANIAGVTLAATLGTAPLIAIHFGTLSPISVIANMVLVPFMPLLMLGSILVTAIAAVSMTAAQYLGLPLYWALHFCITIVEWFARLPFAQISI